MIVTLFSTYPEGPGTFRINNLFRHVEFGVIVRETHEGRAAGIQPRSCIKKDVNVLVLLQRRSQRDNQSTPWNVFGMLPSASSWNVKLMLAKDTSFVKRLPGDNASTRNVGREGSACTAPTVETDVLAETPNMFKTAALGTSVSKRVLVVSTRPARRYAVAGSQASPDQPETYPELQDDPVGSGRALMPPPRRVPVVDNQCKPAGSALVKPRLPRVLRTVLPGAVEDSHCACLVLSPALVPVDDVVSPASSR